MEEIIPTSEEIIKNGVREYMLANPWIFLIPFVRIWLIQAYNAGMQYGVMLADKTVEKYLEEEKRSGTTV